MAQSPLSSLPLILVIRGQSQEEWCLPSRHGKLEGRSARIQNTMQAVCVALSGGPAAARERAQGEHEVCGQPLTNTEPGLPNLPGAPKPFSLPEREELLPYPMTAIQRVQRV